MDIIVPKIGSGQAKFEGWPLDLYSFNGEFDEAARERMVTGGRLLLDFITRYQQELGSYLLEIGPFFNPLLTSQLLEPGQRLAYWENDPYALRWLKENHLSNQIFPVSCNVKDIGKVEFMFQTYPVFVEKQNLKVYTGGYDSIIMSQIFNYISYNEFVAQIRRFINPGGLVFINNVINYGIPEFFSSERPASIEETIQVLEENEFQILEKDILPPPRPTDENRLLLVARYTGAAPVFP